MKEVLRTCCVCRKKQNKNLMYRLSNQGEKIFIDNKKKYCGKATYVCKNDECINSLVNKKVLNKIFKHNIGIDVYKRISEELIDTKH